MPPRATAFQPRATTELLAAVLERGHAAVLSSHSMVHAGVVSGLGGVGKTQVARDYAEQLWTSGDVDVLAWVTATSREAIMSSYARLAANLTGVKDPDSEEGAQRLLEWLSTTSARWLIVLDDVQNAHDLRALWPPVTPTGRVVVTTRRRDAALHGDGRRRIDVGVFTPSEAYAYLKSILVDQSGLQEGLVKLADMMGYLPLALAQAGAYMLDRGLSCAEYVVRLSDRRRRLAMLFPEPEGLPDEHRATVAATWALSVEQANGLQPAGIAQPLLEVAGFLDPHLGLSRDVELI
jgi:hypothetical protein